MSLPQNRQSGPQVYNYGGNHSQGSYIATNQQPRIVNNQNTSQVQPNPIQTTTSVVQPVIPVVTSQPVTTTNQQVVATNQKTSQFKGSRAQQTVSSDKRFSQYHYTNEYKYNLFSLIDEPWNRCLQLGKCGSCPGNECITRQSRRGLWNWN